MVLLKSVLNKQDILQGTTGKISDFQTQMSHFIQEALNIYGAIAEILAPFRSGELQDSIQIEMDDLKGELIPTALHTAYIIIGIPSHEILLKIKNVLYWEGAPHPVACIKHIGTKPNDFIEDTFESGDAEMDKIVDNILEWVRS